jgi:hypothetical protein
MDSVKKTALARIRKARLSLGHLQVESEHAPELGTMVVWPFDTVSEPEIHPVMGLVEMGTTHHYTCGHVRKEVLQTDGISTETHNHPCPECGGHL